MDDFSTQNSSLSGDDIYDPDDEELNDFALPLEDTEPSLSSEAFDDNKDEVGSLPNDSADD
ncbi:MAG: hypothetical protein WCJ58_08195 [bacterium]